ncbi:MAG: Spx/MgsR family RNA polymerase-binding regulatory protein [Oligoflexales bacterium]|nr:Spx/MgsR family RNA polymerase-binding regulatory protein [Oligoflexales bacterium]
MKKSKLYAYKNCQTCKKAIKFLDGESFEYELYAIELKPPSKKELKLALEQNDGQLKKLFNTSGQLYREMGLSKKLADMEESEALELLQENGMLVKRPFLCINAQQTAVGFKEDVWRTLIK